MLGLKGAPRFSGALFISPSAPATAGEGDHPAKQGGGGGAGRNAAQESTQHAEFKFARFSSAGERSSFIAVTFCNDNEARSHAPPPPRFARCASSSGPPPPLSRGRKKRSDPQCQTATHPLVITASPAMTTRNCIAAMRIASGCSFTLAKKACLERTGGDVFASQDVFAPQRGRRSAERRTTVAAPRCAGAAAAQ